jgi:hypothetical protein
MSYSPRLFFTLLLALTSIGARAQPEVFVRADFDLRGPVKDCTVLTDYGEERFEFDRQGRLLKSLTRFSDTDYDITHYRYRDTMLIERRDEVYRDGRFDKSASFARFYQVDSLGGNRDLIEKITSYDQKITEQANYTFDSIGRVAKIIRIREEGIDDTRVVYTSYGGETTSEYFLNGQLSKSIRTSEKKSKAETRTLTLVKEYFQGTPQKAIEEIRDGAGRVLEVSEFGFDPLKEAFYIRERREYTYDEAGFQSGEATVFYSMKSGQPVAGREAQKEFIYQSDGRTPANWIKKITTPENSYITRRINYFSPLPGAATDSLPRN